MGARPYSHLKVDELQQIFASAPHDGARVRAILEELGFRSTAKALDLKRHIENHLKKPATPASNHSESFAQRPRAQKAPPMQETPSQEDAEAYSKDGPAHAASLVDAPPANSDSGTGATDTGSQRQSINQARPAAAPRPQLSPEQAGITQLIDYVRVLIELADKPVWALASYSNVVLHEEDLRNRVGIRHDLTDHDGPIYLKIDRLRRIDPPEPPPAAKDWLTIARDPFREPVVQPLRTVVMSAADVERHFVQGTVDPLDVTKSLKPKPGEDLRDVVLRLDKFPEAKTSVEDYIGRAWAQWSQAERPRRETINIYDRLFSLQQALKLEGSDKPLEVVWGMGMARWKLPPHELDHPLIEQLVELELDDAGAILVRPRGADPILALKPFAATKIRAPISSHGSRAITSLNLPLNVTCHRSRKKHTPPSFAMPARNSTGQAATIQTTCRPTTERCHLPLPISLSLTRGPSMLARGPRISSPPILSACDKPSRRRQHCPSP